MDRRAAPSTFADDYRASLRRFITAGANEPLRAAAYALGRRALAEGRSILDMASLHQRLVVDELRQRGAVAAVAPTVETGGQFFAEVMAPFEMAHRGYADTIHMLQQAKATLEQRVQARTHELQESEKRVARLARIYAILSGINSAIVRLHDRDELLLEACRVAVRQGGFALAWIGLRPELKSIVEPAAWCSRAGGPRDGRAVVDALVDDVPEKIRAVLAGEGPQVEHLAPAGTEPGVCSRIEQCSAFALLPLRLGERVEGIFALYATDAGFFDAAEMRLLDELAGDVSFGLEQIRKEEQHNYAAYYDTLTGLPNTTLLLERLAREIASPRRKGTLVALLLLDLERFSHINDTFGRHVGDDLLRQTAARLREATAEGDTAARVTSDCFGVILTDVPDATQVAHKLENHVFDCLRPPFRADDEEFHLSAKAGIALYPVDAGDADSLFEHAEIALRRAQEEGERYMVYDRAMNRRIVQSVTLESKLRRAIERDELLLYYQPKVSADTLRIAGLEALVRFKDPQNGIVMPSRFVPVLEKTGLIMEAGLWVIRRAADDRRRWVERGLSPPRVAVNVSPIQLRSKNLMPVLTEVAAGMDVNDFGLDIELTESAVMQQVKENIPKLEAARALGYRVVIDDFGTGYSSLSYLSRLPVNALKIDRSFITTMAESPRSLALVTTIISLAHSLNMEVIAEGVEVEEQAKLLRLLRCEQIQGYLYGRALPAEQTFALLQVGHV